MVLFSAASSSACSRVAESRSSGAGADSEGTKHETPRGVWSAHLCLLSLVCLSYSATPLPSGFRGLEVARHQAAPRARRYRTMDLLHGDLAAFPLRDVVLLLAERRQTGVLRVETGPMTGRVFFVDGRVTYATTRDGDGSVAALAQLASRPGRDRRGRNPGGKWPDPARPLILQQIGEVLVRLSHNVSGRFWFVEGVTTRAYGEDKIQRFDVAEVLAAAQGRRKEWEEIARVLPDPSARFVMRPCLAPGVTRAVIPAASWPVLSAVGGGATVQEVAERLELFELSAARLIADLYVESLVVEEHGAETVARVRVDVDGAAASHP